MSSFDVLLWAVPIVTIPALFFSALVIFAAILPMSSLSTGAALALIALAILLPFLCTFGPAQAVHAREAGRLGKAWAWLLSPAICLACVGVVLLI